MAKLAVLILTYNEAKNIATCIKSAAMADEIVVVDSGSSDHTRELAQSLGAKVAVRPMPDGFAAQRNFALTQTDAEWVMYLDADERIPAALAGEIRATVDEDQHYAFEVLRQNFVFGQHMRHGVFRPDWSLRLYPRDKISWTGMVHEQAQVTCPRHRLKNSMNHFTYDNWDRYFDKFNRYTTSMAAKMYEQGKRTGLLSGLFRAGWGFFRVYLLQSGWRDGAQGLIFSIIHFFYTFIKYVKLDYLHRQNQNRHGESGYGAK